jgi:YbgC/YbaW family acyl-CoA thioester hydrolase
MFEFKVEVRGYELDSFGHVNNAVYLNYFEQARWDILKQKNLVDYFRQNKLFLVVTETHIRYSHEATMFDDLLIQTEIKKEAPYLVFYHKIYNQETKIKLCSAEVKSLLTDDKRLPYDIPENFLM